MSKPRSVKFIEILHKYDEKYRNTLQEIVDFISYVDFIKSNAKCTFQYGYTKPTITDKYSGQSYIKACELRHPS